MTELSVPWDRSDADPISDMRVMLDLWASDEYRAVAQEHEALWRQIICLHEPSRLRRLINVTNPDDMVMRPASITDLGLGWQTPEGEW
jgi:hypothetical protein